MPVWILVLTLVLLFLARCISIITAAGSTSRSMRPTPNADQLALYQPKSGAAAMAAHGKAVFETYCGICHGADGLGNPGQAPPLAGSEWVAKMFRRSRISR